MASSPRSPAMAAPIDTNPTHVLLEAIARRRCVETIYNRMQVSLAPYILYTRHDELFVDAVTLERDGRRPKELKLGSFKLAGLAPPRLTEREFAPEPGFDAAAERYAGTTLFVVER